MRGDFMADLLIVRMDSWSSWLAGIATCNGDYFHTFLLIPTFAWTTTHDHQRQTVYRLLYTLCDVGTWFHSNPVRLSFSETSWECKGFFAVSPATLVQWLSISDQFRPLPRGHFQWTFCYLWNVFRDVCDTLRHMNTYDHGFPDVNDHHHQWSHFCVRPPRMGFEPGRS